jgi:hypothetical protein
MFFNLGSAEVILGSAKYLNISLFDIDNKHSEFKIINLPRLKWKKMNKQSYVELDKKG